MGRIRAVSAALLLALVAAAAGPAPAVAQNTPSPSPGAEPEIEVPEAVPGEEVCRITDQRLQTLSGLVALDDGTFAVVNSDRPPWGGVWPIFILDEACQVVDEIAYPSPTLRTEALAYDRERQVLWVGDIGDDFEIRDVEPRPSVALWRVDLSEAGDRTPLIHRLGYPDGPRDGGALVLDDDGTPIIVTHNVGEAELYRPAGELVPGNPPEEAVPLERVGGFTPPDTGTEHRIGRVARQLVTGGANHPDGDRVVLRTYTDAFEFDVEGGDITGAITEGTPRVTPLPGEPMGEAITYSADGEHFFTVSEVVEETGGELPAILRYTPTESAPEPTPTEEPADEPAAAARSLLDRLGPQGIINLIGAVGLIGLLMVVAGIVGIVRARRQPPDEDDEEYDEEYLDEPDGGGYGGAAVHPGGSPVAARARVNPAVPPQPGGYGTPAPAGPAAAAPPPPAAGVPPPSGTVYSAGGGAPSQAYDQPFDQDHPHGYPDAGGHQPPPAPPQPGAGGTYTGGTYTGGTYSGGTYQANQDVPDYYYDDPDYSYEFRDRGDW
jgi:hypothetical protein